MPFCDHCASWAFTLDHDFEYSGGPPVAADLAFKDRTGVTRLILRRPGTLIVTRGYAWNGCSPKVCLFDLLIGTPDGAIDTRTGVPKTYYASCLHDALYQFLPDGLPFGRAAADRCFLDLMTASGFAPRRLYWVAVRALGWMVAWSHRRVRGNRGRCEPLAAPTGG